MHTKMVEKRPWSSVFDSKALENVSDEEDNSSSSNAEEGSRMECLLMSSKRSKLSTTVIDVQQQLHQQHDTQRRGKNSTIFNNNFNNSSNNNDNVCSMQVKDGVPTLLDLCAKITAEHVCYEQIEERYSSLIPEPVQRRLLFWAFPTDERRIRLYSCRASSLTSSCFNSFSSLFRRTTKTTSTDDNNALAALADNGNNGDYSAFTEGLRHLENDCVEDALQIGFHLSGVVRSMCVVNGERYVYHVSMAFDRGKITSVKCSCDHRDINWCHHSVALALYRIRRPERVKFRLTISDSLIQMNRDQLQKLVQYLIAEHYTEVLPTAQKLVDELLLPKSAINAIDGAPDPTAGSALDVCHRWFLDETQTRSRVRAYLSHPPCVDDLHLLFSKVREMLHQRDDNGPRLLRYVTEEFLFVGSARSTSTFQTNVLSEKFQHLWDQLGSLWVCVTLNPYATIDSKSEWIDLLKSWISLPTCPSESAFCLPTNAFCDIHGYQTFGSRQKTVLHRALDACHVKWVDPCLSKILETDLDFVNIDQLPMWIEPFPTACARIDCLKSHGYGRQALVLALSFTKNLKHNRRAYNFSKLHPDGWLGHPLDPVNSLFDCLHEASKIAPGVYSKMLLAMAVEAAVIACAQRRRIPRCRYAKEKAEKQEENLLQKLKNLNVQNDDFLFSIVKQLALDALSHPYESEVYNSNSGSSSSSDKPMPLHSLASYMFQVFLNRDPDLAYKVGLQALQLPFNEDQNTEENHGYLGGGVAGQFTWPIPVSSLETRRSNLASSLLISAKDDVTRLRNVLSAIQTDAKSSNLVHRLAHDIYNEALNHPDASTSRINLLNIAFQLGLQVLKIVANNPSWCRPNVVRWVVTCATSLNFDAVLAVVNNWAQFFTPLEAVSVVARLVWSDAISAQLKLDYHQRTLLSHAVQQLALDCAAKSPSDCALHALSICKNDVNSFEAAYQLVVDAGDKRLVSSEDLFNIAQHMERLGLIPKAYQLALLALSNLRIGYSDETSPSISSVYWTCQLSQTLGGMEFARVISIVVKNIRCATVLSDVLKVCSFPNAPPGMYTGLLAKRLASAQVMILSHPHLRVLLDAAVACYVETVHNRLSHISPRHYCEFIDFLTKARETFVLTEDGDLQFGHLLEQLKILYKGKKKLVTLITNQFG